MMGFDAITVVLGGFSAIALLVMMLVINNTFSVLVAQRTRQYALQRVLGATRGQIRKAVLAEDRKSTRLNSSHVAISYAVFCLKKKQTQILNDLTHEQAHDI